MAKKYDANRDGRIDPNEYLRGEEKFRRLDRDRDGALTAEDFQGPLRGGGTGKMVVNRLVRSADGDRDGSVNGEEWKAFLDSLGADQQGIIDSGTLRARFALEGRGAAPPGTPRLIDRDGDGQVTMDDLRSAFEDLDVDGSGIIERAELGAPASPARRAPQVGEAAPDFELPYAKDESQTVRLSSFTGKRPVALVFGSYT